MLKFVVALPEDRGFLAKDHSFTKNVEEALIFNHEDDVHLYIKKGSRSLRYMGERKRSSFDQNKSC